jgi:hypothetical protein
VFALRPRDSLVDLALFEGNKRFVTKVCLKFEFLTAVFEAKSDYDTLELSIGPIEIDEEEEIVPVSESDPWAKLIGGKVLWGWQFTNHQGYTDGVRLEFIEPGMLRTRGIVEFVVAASMIEISVVVPTERS